MPDLLSAVKADLALWDRKNGRTCEGSEFYPIMENLRAAILAEEAKPKVERVEWWGRQNLRGDPTLIGQQTIDKIAAGFTFYAERPIPPPKPKSRNVELSDQLVSACVDRSHGYDDPECRCVFREAAKALREADRT